MNTLILTINPGSTSTKIAVYNEEQEIFKKSIQHSAEETGKFKAIIEQYEFRKNLILEALNNAGINAKDIKVIMARGGMLKPIASGVYAVNDAMIRDLRIGVQGQHASNLGGIIASELAKTIPGSKAYIADPVIVDELDDLARISGHPEFQRVSIFHALNQKAIARMHAEKSQKRYEDMNLIVAHMGGGISVGAHKAGKVIDVNQALDGDGPFSPERSGTVPVGALARLCFSGKYTLQEVLSMITGKGGYTAYLGTNNALEVEKRCAQGDEKAILIRNAMIYQIAKEIGAMSTVLKGKVDGILLTGGIAYNTSFIEALTERIAHLGPVFTYPGENELEALAMNGLRVLRRAEEIKEYR